MPWIMTIGRATSVARDELRGEARRAEDRRGGAHAHDACVRRLLEKRERGMTAVDHALEVDVDDRVLALERQCVEVAGRCDTGVIEEHIEPVARDGEEFRER